MIFFEHKNSFYSICIILFLTLTSPIFIFSQNQYTPPDRTAHNEVKDDDYVPVPLEQMERSPAYKYSMKGITTVQVNVGSNGENIIGDAANEPSIAINRNNPSKMTIGWRQFNTISSNFRQAGFAFTTNGGTSWTFPGVIEPTLFRSDPVLGSDAAGNIYYNSLTNLPDYNCKVFKSTDGGISWDNGTNAQGGDKQWMTIDKTGRIGDGNIYAFWNGSYSICEPDMFTRSTNKGVSFESCTTIPEEPFWGTLTVNRNGELYTAGSNGQNFTVTKSVNAQNPGVTPTWSFVTVNLDGSISNGMIPNPGGLMGQTNIAVDTSGGPNTGNVYILCSVERFSNSDPLDIMFARSTNGGVTWSSPKRINDDPGMTAYQWFGTMSVAPNGRIDAVWLDTRDNPGGNLSSLYYSGSTDGGLTWSANKRMSGSFNSLIGWPQQNKMGDYFDMISDMNGAHLAWAATFNGEQDVYYSFISDSTIVPVELISFSAELNMDAVTLSWETVSEINNYGFGIEKSVDGKNWISIGFKKGSGTSTEPKQYSFSDKLTGGGTKLYYKLKQIDFNGSFEYSRIAEINYAADFSLSQNYPNPFNPVTNIKYQLPVNGFVSLKIYDVLGKEVSVLVNEEKPAGNYGLEFDAHEFSSGIYFYRIVISYDKPQATPTGTYSAKYSDAKRMILIK